MRYIDLVRKLEKWINVIQKSIIILAIVETIIVLIIGVASNNVTDNNSPAFWRYLLVTLGIIYVVITILKIAYNKSFPSAIVDELKARKELEESKLSISRKDAINDYISSTIIALSRCTCTIPKEQNEDWEILSDKDFTRGMNELTATFNSVLNILLATSNIKFSTGVYVDRFRAIKANNDPDFNGGTYFLRDDYGFTQTDNTKNLMDANDLSGLALEVHNGLRMSFNNGKFYKQEISEGGIVVSQICSNIKNLKEVGQQRGVLFIISHHIPQLPDDIEGVLGMFSNIISHWLELYQHEVIQKQIDNMTPPDE